MEEQTAIVKCKFCQNTMFMGMSEYKRYAAKELDIRCTCKQGRQKRNKGSMELF